jgi:hypothetical protein
LRNRPDRGGNRLTEQSQPFEFGYAAELYPVAGRSTPGGQYELRLKHRHYPEAQQKMLNISGNALATGSE